MTCSNVDVSQALTRCVVIDFEATCWATGQRREDMEIIEFGVILIAGEERREFERFVRPVHQPQLSEFCTQLTTISQQQVDAAATFPDVLAVFADWLGDAPGVMCSWGNYDLTQLQQDCARHRCRFPPALQWHLNVKKLFERQYGARLGLGAAIDQAGLQFVGTPHRGIDDARNTATLLDALRPVSAAEDLRRIAPPANG